jgi:hypothetical protein
VRAYDATGNPLARAARADLAEFLETEPPPLLPGAPAEAAPGKGRSQP